MTSTTKKKMKELPIPEKSRRNDIVKGNAVWYQFFIDVAGMKNRPSGMKTISHHPIIHLIGGGFYP